MLKAALIGAFAGLVVLFLLSNSLNPERISIREALSKGIDDWVDVRGKIAWIKGYDELTLFELCDGSECINVVVNERLEKLGLRENQSIEVLGKIKLYKGKKEIQAEKILA